MTPKDALRQLANITLIPVGIVIGSLPRTSVVAAGNIARSTEPELAVADWTFEIWAAIFVGQLAYGIYQAMPAQRTDPLLRRVGWLTSVNAVLGASWTLAFTEHAYGVAMLAMLAMLACLAVIEARTGDVRSGRSFWLVRAPFALNLGWVAVASILSTAQFLQAAGYDGAPLTPTAWAGIMMGVASLLGALMTLVRGNLVFTAVVIWGLLGVAFYEPIDTAAIANVAALCTLSLLLVIVGELFLANPVGSWRGPQTHP